MNILIVLMPLALALGLTGLAAPGDACIHHARNRARRARL